MYIWQDRSMPTEVTGGIRKNVNTNHVGGGFFVQGMFSLLPFLLMYGLNN